MMIRLVPTLFLASLCPTCKTVYTKFKAVHSLCKRRFAVRPRVDFKTNCQCSKDFAFWMLHISLYAEKRF